MALGDGFAVASRHGSCSRGPAQQSTNSRLARFARSGTRSRASHARRRDGCALLGGLISHQRCRLLTAFLFPEPRPALFARRGRAEAQVPRKCMYIYVPTPDPVSGSSLSRPRRSGVPDVFRKTIFLAKHCRPPDSQIETPGQRCPSHSQNLPSSSEGII